MRASRTPSRMCFRTNSSMSSLTMAHVEHWLSKPFWEGEGMGRPQLGQFIWEPG